MEWSIPLLLVAVALGSAAGGFALGWHHRTPEVRALRQKMRDWRNLAMSLQAKEPAPVSELPTRPGRRGDVA